MRLHISGPCDIHNATSKTVGDLDNTAVTILGICVTTDFHRGVRSLNHSLQSASASALMFQKGIMDLLLCYLDKAPLGTPALTLSKRHL